MTLRALIIGVILGLTIASVTYLNDAVIRQTMLIGSFLPVAVFGTLLIGLVGINPLLRAMGQRWPLRGSELAVVAALGLAACGWPGSNFYRGATTITAMPSHWVGERAAWQAAHVTSYVPGGSALLAQGQVADWHAFADRLVDAGEAEAGGALAALWSRLDDVTRRAVESAASAREGVVEASEINAMTRGINRALAGAEPLVTGVDAAGGDPVLASRLALVEATDGLVMPPPPGDGVLLQGGEADDHTLRPLLVGRSADERLSLTELPWAEWWPVIRLWGGVALLLGVMSLALAVIVHPQWSRRELLSYPVARFVDEVCETKPGQWLPAVFRNRLFWIGVASMIALHGINGLHAWFEWVPEVSRQLNLNPLKELFPNARRVPSSWGYFAPKVYFTVIAFSFFLSTNLSFSLGTSQLVYMAFGGALIANGVTLEHQLTGSKEQNMLLFGAYLGMAAMILYTGRRYYLNVAASAVGWPRAKETPPASTWAMRLLGVCFVGAVALLASSGLDWPMAALFTLLILVLVTVMSRVVAETGCFFLQPWWTPLGVLVGLLGFEAIGPTTFLILGIGSLMLVGDPREAVMPFLVNALQIGDKTADAPPRRLSPWLGGVMIAALLVAGAVTLYTQYNFGVNTSDRWAMRTLPTMSIDAMAEAHGEALVDGTLGESTRARGLSRFAAVEPSGAAVLWGGAGLALVLGTAVARLRLPWWPIHPVMFLVWGTYPISQFGVSFLFGWLVKLAVTKVGGAKGYHLVKPLMIGLIAGEIFSALLWTTVGAAYAIVTGGQPETYQVFPG